jgi:chromosome segregation ATPase
MTMSSPIRVLSSTLVLMTLAGALLAGGCASSGTQRASGASTSMSDLRTELTSAKTQVGETTAALGALPSPATTDLSAAFATYQNELRDLEAVAQRARDRANAMRTRVQEYYDNWEEELEGISSESIRELSEQRRQAAVEAFDKINAAAQELRDAYDLFVTDLRDISTFLENDLNPTGVAAISEMITKANEDGKVVNGHIDAMIAELDAVRDAMTQERPAETSGGSGTP